MHINITNIDMLIQQADNMDTLSHLAGQAYCLINDAEFNQHLTPILARRAERAYHEATRRRTEMLPRSDLATFI